MFNCQAESALEVFLCLGFRIPHACHKVLIQQEVLTAQVAKLTFLVFQVPESIEQEFKFFEILKSRDKLFDELGRHPGEFDLPIWKTSKCFHGVLFRVKFARGQCGV